VSGYADISGATAKVRIGSCGGTVTFENAIGDIWVGEAADGVDVSTAIGSITVDRANANVTAKTSNGSIRIGALTRGDAWLTTALGGVEIGISQGTTALVDARSTMGSVYNSLAVQDSPDQFTQKVKVHARTWSGNVHIRRAAQRSPSSSRWTP
jgi:DUF4097 and DUF4098 domain-containing protein YvlB